MKIDTKMVGQFEWLGLLAMSLLVIYGCETSSETPAPDSAGAINSVPVDPIPIRSEHAISESSQHAQASAVANTPLIAGKAYDRKPEISDSVVIGLDADMSSGSAFSGEAIRRGMVLAVDEINRSGGVLGRPLEVIVRDHRGNPARGVDNIHEFASMDRVIAVMGGIHTPVALQELESIHKHRLIYLGPWAAGTRIVKNDYTPNFVFRVSVRDEFAGGFLVQQAVERGHKRLGLLLEQTGWGRSNEMAIKNALREHHLTPAGVEWFHWGVDSLDTQLKRLSDAGSDVVILVSNPLEGVAAIRSMAACDADKRLPIISHWGITAGNIFDSVSIELSEIDIVFLQTCSFVKPAQPGRTAQFVTRYCERFNDCDDARAIFAPVGTAHSYDLVHLLARAVDLAGTTSRAAVRDAMEQIEQHEGVVRDYRPPFTASRHDALNVKDFRLARFSSDGAIVPVED